MRRTIVVAVGRYSRSRRSSIRHGDHHSHPHAHSHASWFRVLDGILLVVKSLKDKTMDDIRTVGDRSTKHGFDMISTTISMIQEQYHQQEYQQQQQYQQQRQRIQQRQRQQQQQQQQQQSTSLFTTATTSAEGAEATTSPSSAPLSRIVFADNENDDDKNNNKKKKKKMSNISRSSSNRMDDDDHNDSSEESSSPPGIMIRSSSSKNKNNSMSVSAVDVVVEDDDDDHDDDDDNEERQQDKSDPPDDDDNKKKKKEEILVEHTTTTSNDDNNNNNNNKQKTMQKEQQQQIQEEEETETKTTTTTATTTTATTTTAENNKNKIKNNSIVVSSSFEEEEVEGEAVPSSRISRAVGFASLGIGLAYGAASEGISRFFFQSARRNNHHNKRDTSSNPHPSSDDQTTMATTTTTTTATSDDDHGIIASNEKITTTTTKFNPTSTTSSFFSSSSSASSSSSSSIFLNDDNVDRFVSTLCRMRGAALKMGQMLSIQDETLLPSTLMNALQRVRQNATSMPKYQLYEQLQTQLGEDWNDQFITFNEIPFAAASIGQVHYATIEDNNNDDNNNNNNKVKDVVVKVQYPGVANSIESDIRNLSMLVNISGIAPRGLYIDNVMRVGREELLVECNYRKYEMKNQLKMKQFVQNDDFLNGRRHHNVFVPNVIDHLTTEQIITTEYCMGDTIDKACSLVEDQNERNRIGEVIMYLTIRELFSWKFMQTDPNWSNFLYDGSNNNNTRTISLIDFGSTRAYSEEFVSGYRDIVWSSANHDKEQLMERSYDMGFLTGEENNDMIRAHIESAYTVGEPFYIDDIYDFTKSNIAYRMSQNMNIFLKHRLIPPPDEVYTLHRKLAGTYMLCIKLQCKINCRQILQNILFEK